MSSSPQNFDPHSYTELAQILAVHHRKKAEWVRRWFRGQGAVFWRSRPMVTGVTVPRKPLLLFEFGGQAAVRRIEPKVARFAWAAHSPTPTQKPNLGHARGRGMGQVFLSCLSVDILQENGTWLFRRPLGPGHQSPFQGIPIWLSLANKPKLFFLRVFRGLYFAETGFTTKKALIPPPFPPQKVRNASTYLLLVSFLTTNDTGRLGAGHRWRRSTMKGYYGESTNP